MAKDTETVLEGFQEGPMKFPPTYKFDVGTNTYDTRYRLTNLSGLTEFSKLGQTMNELKELKPTDLKQDLTFQ